MGPPLLARTGSFSGAVDARSQILARGWPHRQRLRGQESVLLLSAGGRVRKRVARGLCFGRQFRRGDPCGNQTNRAAVRSLGRGGSGFVIFGVAVHLPEIVKRSEERRVGKGG